LHFSSQALSSVFTSDKLLITVLVHVLRSKIADIRSVDSSCANVADSNAHFSSSNIQYLSRSIRKLSSEKSATFPARQKHDGSKCRRLSEPAVTTTEQKRTSQTQPDKNVSPVRGRHDDSSMSAENSSRSAVSKMFGFKNHSVCFDSASECCAVSSASDAVEKVVVNPVYASDDCSTLKSLSLENRDLSSCDHSTALGHMQHVPQKMDCVSSSYQHASLTSSQEATVTDAASPVSGDCAAEADFVFLDAPASRLDFPADSCGCTNVICDRFGYRKLCVYLQEGTWRHSPHTLHCIQIDNDISLVVLCEVMTQVVLITFCNYSIVCNTYNLIKKHITMVKVQLIL